MLHQYWHPRIYAVIFFVLFISGCGHRPEDIDISFGPEKKAADPGTALMKGIAPENIGYLLYDLESGEAVRSHNRSRAFIPASTTKIASTVAALDVLGPDFRFTTRLCYEGSVSKGVLKGDLYLKGSGDPLLTVSNLMEMTDRMKDKGIRSVSGRFIYDDGDLGGAECIDSGMEPDMSFNPGVSALSLEYNAVTAQWKRDRQTHSIGIYLTPSLLINSASLSAEKLGENTRFAYRDDGGVETWLLTPDEDRDGSERLPVRKPSRFTAHVFARLCAIRGITLPRPVPGTMPRSADEIAVHRGPALTEIADITLTFSINLAAELIMLRTAKELTGAAMKPIGAAGHVSRYLSGRLENVPWKNFFMVNGSGLTVRNRVTPEQMTALLIYADAQRYNGTRYRTLMPSSGIEWSLVNRLSDPHSAMRVWAKTGTINYAIALAGYLFTESGRTMAFAIFINDMTERERYDADPDRRSRESSRRVTAWLNNAKNVMDAIVASWIREL